MRNLCAVIFLASGLCGSLGAQTDREDSLARQALASNNYGAVVAAYAGAEQTSLSDVALYRLAIAEFKLGRPVPATELFARALALNPSGTFASSPERLQSWKLTFAQAATQKVSSSDPVPSDSPLAPVISPHSSAKTQSTKTLDSVAPLEKPNEQTQAIGFRVLLVFSVFVLFVIFFAFPYFKSGRRYVSFVHSSDGLLDKQLVAARDAMGALLKSIEAGQGQGTELYAILKQTLPVIEREVGRHRYFAFHDDGSLQVDDADVLRSIERLKKQPMRLSNARGVDVAALFQASGRSV